MNKNNQTPVPWQFHESHLLSTWTWETPHFRAMIIAEGLQKDDNGMLDPTRRAMYSWRVSDKTQYAGMAVPLDSSTAISYKAAKDELLELIGKSYDRVLGYQQYAGRLATTYKLFNEQSYDLVTLIGESLEIIIKSDEGDDEPVVLRGLFDVDHYDVVLRTEDHQTRIPPIRILDIRQEYTDKSLLPGLSAN